MKFKNFIKKVWYKCKRLFYKRTPTADIVISESKEVLSSDIIHNEFIDKIQESSDIIIKEALLKQLAKFETAKAILNHVEYQPQVSFLNNKNKKKFFELHELRDELQKLNERKVELEIKGSNIYLDEFENSTFWNNRINELRNLLNKNKLEDKIKLTNTTNSSIDNSINQIENLFKYNSVLLKLKTRESEKLKQQKIYENKISKELGTLEYYITQNKYNEAKELSKLLSISIKPNDKHNTKRFNKALEKLKNKELSVYVQSREELLKKHNDEAEKTRKRNDRIKRQINNNRSSKLIQYELNLESEKILDKYSIEYLFHMTEISNIKNIFKFGLLSHSEAYVKELNVINISLNDVNQRRANKAPINGKSLHEYVPLYFNPKNPMLFLRKQLQDNIVILAIDRRVIYNQNSIFSDGNAASDSTTFYNNISDLNQLNWKCIKNEYWNDYDDGKRIKCAETLAYSNIPIKYIQKIYCNNISTKKVIENYKLKDMTFKVELNSKLFFNK